MNARLIDDKSLSVGRSNQTTKQRNGITIFTNESY